MDTNLYSDNALHTITIQLYYVNTLAVPNGSGFVTVFVDNNAPTAGIFFFVSFFFSFFLLCFEFF